MSETSPKFELNSTDLDILTALSDGRRQSRTNLAQIVDKDSGYVGDRLSRLLNKESITRVGISDQSNLYEITGEGRFQLRWQSLSDKEASILPVQMYAEPDQRFLFHLSPMTFDIMEVLSLKGEIGLHSLSKRFTKPNNLVNHMVQSAEYQWLVKTEDVESGSEGSMNIKLRPFGKVAVEGRKMWEIHGDRPLSVALIGGSTSKNIVRQLARDDQTPDEVLAKANPFYLQWSGMDEIPQGFHLPDEVFETD